MTNRFESEFDIDYNLIYRYLKRLDKNSNENKFDEKFIDKALILCCNLIPKEKAFCIGYEELCLAYMKKNEVHSKVNYSKDINKILKLVRFLFSSLKSIDKYLELYDSGDAIGNDFLYKILSTLLGILFIQEDIYNYLQKFSAVVNCSSEFIVFDEILELELDEKTLDTVKSAISAINNEIKEINKFALYAIFANIKDIVLKRFKKK